MTNKRTLEQGRGDFISALTEEQATTIIDAANGAHAERLDLSTYGSGDEKFNLDQLLADSGFVERQDGEFSSGMLPLTDVDVPEGAKDGDVLPVSAVRSWDEFSIGEQFPGEPYFGGPFFEGDFELVLNEVEYEDDAWAGLLLRDRNAVERRVLAEIIANDSVDTVDEALSHPDHHARAAAFRAVLDEMGVEYDRAGIEGISSEYVYVPTEFDEDGAAIDLGIKVRFADHLRQSAFHERAEFNIADGGYNSALEALEYIAKEIPRPQRSLGDNPSNTVANHYEGQDDLAPGTSNERGNGENIREFFQNQGNKPRGSIDLTDPNNIIINLFKAENLSTFLHESGHLYLEMMGDLVQEPGASEGFKADYQTVRDWLGLKDGEVMTREHHEQFAETWEVYLKDGKAPSVGLMDAFAKFSAWLNTYHDPAKLCRLIEAHGFCAMVTKKQNIVVYELAETGRCPLATLIPQSEFVLDWLGY